MTLHVRLSKTGCLTDEALDILMLANQHMSVDSKRTALEHIGECSWCRARCINRSASLTATRQDAVLKPDGFRPIPAGPLRLSSASLSSASACIAAVSILGVALLSPLFLRQGMPVVAPLVRQHKEGNTNPAASDSHDSAHKNGDGKVELTPAQQDALLQRRMMVLKKLEEENALKRRLKGATPSIELTPAQRKALMQERIIVQKMLRARKAQKQRLRGVMPGVELTPARREALLKERMMVQKMLREQKNLLNNSEAPHEKRIQRH